MPSRNRTRPGIKFETYAISRIKGAIIRRAARHRLDPAVGAVQGPGGREGVRAPGEPAPPHPTDAEVAQQLGISTDELHHIFNQISFVSVVALDELLTVGLERGDWLSLVDTLEDKSAEDPEAAFESEEMKSILAGAINRLAEREIVITPTATRA